MTLAIILGAALFFLLGFLLGKQRKTREQTDLKAEFRQLATEAAKAESTSLRRLHRDTLLELLDPLDRDIKDFHTLFVRGNAEVKTSVETLFQQTQTLGKQAEELSRALRGNSKVQGNWGEGVLRNLLEASGLRRGEDFEEQVHFRGGQLIPDVLINLPEERRLIVDSKVSLTAFVRYVNAEDEEERRQALKAHVESVRQHVRELSDKRYDHHVPGAVGHVLMFIPNEAAYVAAVTADPTLNTEAYRRRIILLNPANLLMALQLVHHIWQTERQSRSVEEIFHSAEALYKKFTLFGETFVRIGTGIDSLRRTYETAENQLASGRGSIVKQLEGWKEKGLTTSAHLPERLDTIAKSDA